MIVSACLTLTVALALLTATSSIVGLAFHYIDGRNLMPASIQMASYLSTYLLIWPSVAHVLVVLPFVAEGLIRAMP